jgi:DNA-binding transcriptional LysR family regulator
MQTMPQAQTTLRLPGGPYRWEFERGRKSVTIGVNGPLIIDDTHLVIEAALAGAGLGFVYEEQVAEDIAQRITPIVSISLLHCLHW